MPKDYDMNKLQSQANTRMKEFASGVKKGFKDTMSAAVRPVKPYVDTMSEVPKEFVDAIMPKKRYPKMPYAEARRLDPKMAVREGEIVDGKVYTKPPTASKGVPPSRRKPVDRKIDADTGMMYEVKPMKMMRMPKMRNIEPLKKIDYEGDFDKAFNASLPNRKQSRKQMMSGKQNFRDVAQNKADRAVLTKGMKK